MSFPCPVGGCDRDATEWQICRSCASRLAGDLAEIPVLAAELDVTLARQGAQAGRGGSRTATPPLAYDPRASAAHGALKALLVGWVQAVAEETGANLPEDTTAGCAHWLLVRVGELRVHPAAGDIAAEIGAQVAACRRVLQPTRRGRIHLPDPCPDCGAPLQATMFDVDDPRPNLIWCLGAPPHKFAPHQWLRLGRRLGRGQESA